MARSRTRKLIGLILLLVVLAVLINVIAMLVEPDKWAVDAAKAACRERGLQLDEVNGSKSEIISNFIGMTAEIHFKGRRQNRPTTIHGSLRNPLHFLSWQVVEVREAGENGG